MDTIARVTGLTHRYRDTLALDNVDLAISSLMTRSMGRWSA